MHTKIVPARKRDMRKSTRDASAQLARQMNEESGITQDFAGGMFAQDLPQGVASALPAAQVDDLLIAATAGTPQAQQQAAVQAQQQQDAAQAQCCQLMNILGSRSLTNGQKWTLAFVGAVLFFILALPVLWSSVGGLIARVGVNGQTVAVGQSYPSIVQVLVHAIVFLLIFRLILW